MLYTSNTFFIINMTDINNNEQNIIYNLNFLYSAYLRSKKGSNWKPQVQKFGMDYLTNLVKTKDSLKTRNYKSKPCSKFPIRERGKTRQITGLQMSDRVVRHSLCDNVLTPELLSYMIYDNGASLKNKGIGFSRERFEKHLHDYYRRNGNDGYILLMDFSKFYDNIPHDKAFKAIAKHVHDEFALWLLERVFDDFKIDVSYMSDSEYAECMDKIFDTAVYRANVTESQKTGDKFMRKSVNIGDQCSQIIGIFYPTPIDNYIKIVKSQKYYGRYMDDSYIISKDKEELRQLANEISDIAKDMGIFLNKKKTRIVKLSDYYRFLQITYSLTDTGHLIRKINSKRIVDMRRKLKKLAVKVKNGERTQLEIENMFKSWMCEHAYLMSRLQRDNLNLLYYDLFGGFLDERYYLRYYPRRRDKNSNYIKRQ